MWRIAVGPQQPGQDSHDSLKLGADGQVQIQRTPVRRERLGASKYIHLRYWLHLVFNAPEISAATNPQSMKSPLSVWLKQHSN